MEIFLDPKFVAIGFTINIIISTLKPFLKLDAKYKKLTLRGTVILSGICAAILFHKTSITTNSLYIDSCIIIAISFVIYHLGMKQIIDKVKEKI